MSHHPPVPASTAVTSPPASPSIDWDGAADLYRRSTTRPPSLAHPSPSSSSPQSTMIPPVPSPFHRPTSPQRPTLLTTTTPSPSHSSPSPPSSSSSSILRGNPPPVPNQFKRGASPSVTVYTPTSSIASSHPASSPSSTFTPHPAYPSPTPSSTSSPLPPPSPTPSSSPSSSIPLAPAPPLTSPPLSFLRSSQLAPVMSELRQVYTPFPAYSSSGPSPSPTHATVAGGAPPSPHPRWPGCALW